MSDPATRLELLFLWHFHQPDYRSPRTGAAQLPWVRLHAVKDYLDMALRLERHPRLRATFNFVPSLVDQLEDAAAGKPDALFDLITRPATDLSPEERAEVTRRCAAQPARLGEPWPEYASLCRRARRAAGRGAALAPREIETLEAWFLLAWLDPMFHGEPEAQAALARSRDLGAAERDALLALHTRLIAGVIPAYRRLAERGQVELSASPYAHPILPLLVDTASARRARPDLRLPSPGLAAPEDAARQVERALARHAEAFGARPFGLWPSEGSVSPEVAAMVAAQGLRWMATDEGVLWRSLPAEGRKRDALHQPWCLETGAGSVHFFFRDHELSDRIGFVYQNWEAHDAVADFMSRLKRIGEEHGGDPPPLVTVALDGENCWEHYPGDGGPFLDALYAALEAEPTIRTVTPAEVLERRGPGASLATLHTGSWIDADLHVWIGHPEKNRAWERIAAARADLVASGITEVSAPRAWESLHAAEGSDWFWWFGVDHHTSDKAIFDRILREHLAGTYECRGAAPPAWVEEPIAAVLEPAADFAPLGYIHPVIDGRVTSYFEWRWAGRLEPGGGAMHRDAGPIQAVSYGFDERRIFLRVDLERSPDREVGRLEIETGAGSSRRTAVAPAGPGEHEVRDPNGAVLPGARCAVGKILELEIPLSALALEPGAEVALVVRARTADGTLLGEAGSRDGMPIRISGPEDEAAQWSA